MNRSFAPYNSFHPIRLLINSSRSYGSIIFAYHLGRWIFLAQVSSSRFCTFCDEKLQNCRAPLCASVLVLYGGGSSSNHRPIGRSNCRAIFRRYNRKIDYATGKWLLARGCHANDTRQEISAWHFSHGTAATCLNERAVSGNAARTCTGFWRLLGNQVTTRSRLDRGRQVNNSSHWSRSDGVFSRLMKVRFALPGAFVN